MKQFLSGNKNVDTVIMSYSLMFCAVMAIMTYLRVYFIEMGHPEIGGHIFLLGYGTVLLLSPVSSQIIAFLGFKKTLLLGSFFYLLLSVSLVIGSIPLIYGCTLLMGLAASTLVASKENYFTVISKNEATEIVDRKGISRGRKFRKIKSTGDQLLQSYTLHFNVMHSAGIVVGLIFAGLILDMISAQSGPKPEDFRIMFSIMIVAIVVSISLISRIQDLPPVIKVDFKALGKTYFHVETVLYGALPFVAHSFYALVAFHLPFHIHGVTGSLGWIGYLSGGVTFMSFLMMVGFKIYQKKVKKDRIEMRQFVITAISVGLLACVVLSKASDIQTVFVGTVLISILLTIMMNINPLLPKMIDREEDNLENIKGVHTTARYLGFVITIAISHVFRDDLYFIYKIQIGILIVAAGMFFATQYFKSHLSKPERMFWYLFVRRGNVSV